LNCNTVFHQLILPCAACANCQGYFYERFLEVQRAVDISIMSELGGGSALQDTSVMLKSFPYPPYNEDPFIMDLQIIPLITVLSFIVTATTICKDVVLEKEKKLKVGISRLVFHIVW